MAVGTAKVIQVVDPLFCSEMLLYRTHYNCITDGIASFVFMADGTANYLIKGLPYFKFLGVKQSFIPYVW